MDQLKIQKCIGCGYCCMEAPCSAAVRLYGNSYPCPALTWSELEQRHYCNLCQLPRAVGEAFREELCINAGCCSNLNSWRREPLQNRTLIKKVTSLSIQSDIDKYFQIFLSCCGTPFLLTEDTLFLLLNHFKYKLNQQGMPSDKIQNLMDQIIYYIYENKDNQFRSFTG